LNLIKFNTNIFEYLNVCRMFATYNTKTMRKPEVFDKELQDLAEFAKVISHPARLAILKYLAETKTCISGDITDKLPLSRTTVSQHLKELRDKGLIHGEIDGLKINYCLCSPEIEENLKKIEEFFNKVKSAKVSCC
jgi:DNA-binding transcriptional ArsR family regulator